MSMPNMGAAQPCCLSSASGGGGACMGLKILCLNLSHCLDLVSVPVCVCVYECARACVYACVSLCVRVCGCVYECVSQMWMSMCWYQ